MRTIKLSNGTEVQVSDEIYKDTYGELYRKINGLQGHKELGWHPSPDWNCFIRLDFCYDGIDAHVAYRGIELEKVSPYHTHPLNHRGPR